MARLCRAAATNAIASNATGCSSLEEVETTCTVAGGFTINADVDVIDNVALLKRITGDLVIGGGITEIP